MCCRDSTVGSDIGQGYVGDEDNGEMSGWWLFSAAGFYPLRMGTPEYVIGAPYFPHMDIALENGKHIVINATGVSDSNRYVQSLRVNGKPWNKLTLPHALLAQGATLDFTMGPQPSKWGSSEHALPVRLRPTANPRRCATWLALAKDEASSEPAISNVDACSITPAIPKRSCPARMPSVGWHFPQPRAVAMYTLTSRCANCSSIELAAGSLG